MELFTMDDKLPTELRALPYDLNSVMHFDERDFSKNGHRTIVILDHKIKQNRQTLSDLDLRKIDIVYGPECRKRDRQEKIDLCQGFPGVARRKRSLNQLVRRKREVDPTEIKSLRVNPNITPPPELLNNSTKDVDTVIEELGIKDGVEEITNLVFKVGALALTNTRNKYCNNTENTAEVTTTKLSRRSDDQKPDILGVVENVADFVKDMVDHALSNLTAFCETETDFKAYQRARCPFYSEGGGGGTCWGNYKSTKHGPVMYSTQHRPWIVQSTKHDGGNVKRILYHSDRRNNEESGTKTELKGDGVRKKRDTNFQNVKEKDERRFEGRRYNVRTKEHARWDDSDLTMERHKRKQKRDESYERDDVPMEETSQEERRPEKKGANLKRFKGFVPKTVELSKKNKEFYGERMWPDGIVRYIITKDETFDLADLRRRLEAVNRILKERTCVRLEEITEEDAERFEDYLVLDASADYITGRVGGRQNFGSLELFEGGQHKQHTAMMVMAMLGFYFELARHDRDSYVRVHMRHVRADKLHHFEKIRSDATLALPYDYESATHPAWQFWRKLGRTGISTVATYKEKDPDGSIMRSLGQHEKLLSDLDIVKINSVYGVKCFMETEHNDETVDHDLDQEGIEDKYKDRQRDSDTENRDLEKHKVNLDRHRIILEGRDNDKYKISDRERNEGRHRDKYRNKHNNGRGRDDRDRKERERHRRPQHESDEDREEMERLREKGTGIKEEVDKPSRDRYKESLHERDWDLEDKTNVNDDRDKSDEVRPGVVAKHGGMKDKSKHKKRDETDIEQERPGGHVKDGYESHKYQDEDAYAPNRYQIKDREDRDRKRQRIRESSLSYDRNRHGMDEKNRDRDRHRDRRVKNREEWERDRNRHRHRDDDRRENDFYTGRPIGRERKEGYNDGSPTDKEFEGHNDERTIEKPVREGHSGHLVASELKGTEIKWKAGENQVPRQAERPTVPQNVVRTSIRV